MDFKDHDIHVYNLKDKLDKYTWHSLRYRINIYDLFVKYGTRRVDENELCFYISLYKNNTFIGAYGIQYIDENEISYFPKKHILLDMLYVNTEFRNKGYGTILINRIKNIGLPIRVLIRKRHRGKNYYSKTLKEFYIKNGFVETDTSKVLMISDSITYHYLR